MENKKTIEACIKLLRSTLGGMTPNDADTVVSNVAIILEDINTSFK